MSEQGWRAIESAPNDQPVLTYRSVGLMAVAEHIVDPRNWPHLTGRIWCCTDGMELLDVSHWMPLPDPPKAQE